jgi:hypothetical protein
MRLIEIYTSPGISTPPEAQISHGIIAEDHPAQSFDLQPILNFPKTILFSFHRELTNHKRGIGALNCGAQQKYWLLSFSSI